MATQSKNKTINRIISHRLPTSEFVDGWLLSGFCGASKNNKLIIPGRNTNAKDKKGHVGPLSVIFMT
jgi:hypothetical protein